MKYIRSNGRGIEIKQLGLVDSTSIKMILYLLNANYVYVFTNGVLPESVLNVASAALLIVTTIVRKLLGGLKMVDYDSTSIVRNNGFIIAVGAVIFGIITLINWFLSILPLIILGLVIATVITYAVIRLTRSWDRDGMRGIRVMTILAGFCFACYIGFHVPYGMYESSEEAKKKQDPYYVMGQATNNVTQGLDKTISDTQAAIDMAMKQNKFDLARQGYQKILEACYLNKDNDKLKAWMDKYEAFSLQTNKNYFAADDKYLQVYKGYLLESSGDKSVALKSYRNIAFGNKTPGQYPDDLVKHAQEFLIANPPQFANARDAVAEGELYESRAFRHYQAKDYDQALRDYNVALYFYPKNYINLYSVLPHRATILALKGQYQQSLNDYIAAIESARNGGDPKMLFGAAQNYEKLGNKEKALDYYRRLLKVLPQGYVADYTTKARARIENDWNRMPEWVVYD